MRAARSLAFVLSALSLAGCYGLRGSSGGGEADFSGPRALAPDDVALPDGYRIEVVARGFTFPTGVVLDGHGVPHVVEAGYSYGEAFTTPRLVRVERDGSLRAVATGASNGPWTGAAFVDGAFVVSEGGQLEGGRILRIGADGGIEVLVEGLPSLGDHHTDAPALGPDGWIYFGQGTATNSGVVGPDNAQYGWLARHPRFHDVPCADVRLAGARYESDDPGGGTIVTGAFQPFGVSDAEQIPGRIPCSGSILRLHPGTRALELVAWGFRNPFAVAFSPDGRLFATDNGYDVRGSRPVYGAADVLWEVQRGRWHGWPDFSAGQPLDTPRFRPRDGEPVRRLLAEHPNPPPRPAAVLAVNSSSNGFDFSRSARFGHVGEAFVAQFGDLTPTTGKVMAPVGFKVVRVDPETGAVEDFAVNRGQRNGPASLLGTGGLERPIAARFDAAGEALYVVDFGVMTVEGGGPVPRAGTGVLWRITRSGGAR